MTILNSSGRRKYLTSEERAIFIQTASSRDDNVYSFCWILAATGCRISEILSVCDYHVDFEESQIVIECLKKRRKSVFRTIPLPSNLLNLLKDVIGAKEDGAERLWPWSRMTGYRRVREVMQEAGIEGAHASPKGLRHAFGVCAVQANVPLNLVQRWLGHADLKTTSIYTDAVGPEERAFASRIWIAGADQEPTRTRRTRRRQPRAEPARMVIAAHLPAPSATPQERQWDDPSFDPRRRESALFKLAARLNVHVRGAIVNPRQSTDCELDLFL